MQAGRCIVWPSRSVSTCCLISVISFIYTHRIQERPMSTIYGIKIETFQWPLLPIEHKCSWYRSTPAAVANHLDPARGATHSVCTTRCTSPACSPCPTKWTHAHRVKGSSDLYGEHSHRVPHVLLAFTALGLNVISFVGTLL